MKDGYSWTTQMTGPFGTYAATAVVLVGTKLIDGAGTKMIVEPDGAIIYAISDLNGVRLDGFHFPPANFVYLHPPMLILECTATIPETVISTGLAECVPGSIGTLWELWKGSREGGSCPPRGGR